MPFGLRNAAQTFQRFMDEVTRGLQGVFVYLDDILVASRTSKEHEKHLLALFIRLRDHGLVISPEKSVFGRNSMEFLGFQISSTGLSPLPARVQAIVDFPAPRDVRAMQRFIGMVNYYNRFIPSCGTHLIPFYAQLRPEPGQAVAKPSRAIHWSEELQRAFDSLKHCLQNAAILHHPAPGTRLAISVDASDVGVGAVLEQLVVGQWQPLAFFSRALDSTQRRYSTFDRELLAIKLAIRHFRYFIEGEMFTVFTDHKPLIGAMARQNPSWSPRQHRHFAEIAEYTSDLRHVSGKDNVVADALSRVFAAAPLPINWHDFQRDQEADHDVRLFSTSITGLKVQLVQVQGLPIHCDVSKGYPRPIVPLVWRRRVFDLLHDLSHPGVKATIALVSQRFVWHDMNRQIKSWVQGCSSCQSSKVHRHIHHPVQQLDPPSGRFSHVHVDIVGPLPASSGFRYLFTVVDRWTRWPEAIPMVEATAEACARAFISGWVQRFGCPETVTSDRGKPFISQLWRQLAQTLGASAVQTTSYHPQANGMVERFHRSLKASLMARLEEKEDWVQELPIVLLGLRSAIKDDLGHSSAEAVFGETLRLPGAFLSSEPMPVSGEFIKAVRERISQFPLIQPPRHGHIGSPSGQEALRVATHVYIRQDHVQPPLSRPYRGPFRVLDRQRDYFVLDINGKPDSVAITRLKPAATSNQLLGHRLSSPSHQTTRFGRTSHPPVRFPA